MKNNFCPSAIELFLFLNCEGGGVNRKVPYEIVKLNSETVHSGQQGRCNRISQHSVNEDSFLAELVYNEKP